MRSDEDELGLTYNQIDDYLENKELSEDIITKIEKLYITTRHKRVLRVTPLDIWWH